MYFHRSRQTIAHLLQTLVFCGLLILGLLVLQTALLPPAVSSDSWPGYVRLEKNSVDVLFVGNSHAECTFAPMVIYRETGVTSWVLKSGGINTRQKLAYLEEALKTQHPKLIVFEIYGFDIPTRNTDYRNAPAFARMPVGLPKISAIFATSEATATPSLLLPLISNHSRVWELTGASAPGNTQFTGGALALTDYGSSDISELLIKRKKDPAPLLTQSQLAENMRYLEQVAELARKNDCRLIFTISPLLDPSLKAGCEQIKKRIIETPDLNGADVLDMNDFYRSIGLQQTDFRDLSHMYVTGLGKSSTWFARVVLPIYKVDQATKLSPNQKQWWEKQSAFWMLDYAQ